eukprot:scaffold16563_cov87-Skeletonema_dohrnii-CCMP3373.AAC.4
MQAAEDDDEIFVYTGGDQVVPQNVRRVRIDRSVKVIPQRAFEHRTHLISVEFHDGIEIIEENAFYRCKKMRGPIKLLGVKIIKVAAFMYCFALADIEFGDKLETVGDRSFSYCRSLTNITIPSVKIIKCGAFGDCKQLTDLVLPEGLETIQRFAFDRCERLRRIAIPLKDDLIEDDAFECGENLATIDLVGGIHKTVASLHLERWRNDMKDEINRIHQILLNYHSFYQTGAIQRWIGSVIHKIEHYKVEHQVVLKEATTLLELALWKANLDGNVGGILEQTEVRTTRRQLKRARKEKCVTSGA